MRRNTREYKAVDISFTKLLAKGIAKTVEPPSIITIFGDLGVGKTTFTKFFIKTFLPDEIVSSPTFNIISRYDTCNFAIWHLDLYRIKSLDELYDVGVEDVLNSGIAIVEWPKLIKKLITPNIEISINYNSDGYNLRDIVISTKFEKRISNVSQTLDLLKRF